MKIENDHIYNMDCLDGMRNIHDKSIDCVVTDCPYKIVGGGCSEDNHNQTSGILNKRKTKHESISGVLNDQVNAVRSGKMFANNDIKFSEWLPDVYRVLKDGTHCYIMVNSRNLKELQQAAEDVGFAFQNLLVWNKSNATPNKYYMQQLEFILMLSKRPARNINDMGQSNLLSVRNIIGNKVHPTEKPISLMEVLIKNSTNEGDVVLDPFAGGGSTLIAAKRAGRKFIGMEVDKKYYEIARKRLYEEPQQQLLW